MEIRIYGIEQNDYHEGITREEFMAIAEQNGNVWSRTKFNEYGIPIGGLILRVYGVRKK